MIDEHSSIKQFKEQCMPIIQFYEAQNLVTRINANKSIPEVIFYHTIF